MNRKFWENSIQIYDDLTQTSACSTAQALMMENGAAWEEYGHMVENGKERVNFVKLGFPFDNFDEISHAQKSFH